MDYEVIHNQITVAQCGGATPDGQVHIERRHWPMGSVVRLFDEDARSLLACGAVKELVPSKAQQAMATAAIPAPVADEPTKEAHVETGWAVAVEPPPMPKPRASSAKK